MPRLLVVAVSARLPDWAEAACAEYARRMPRGYEVSRLPVKAQSKVRAAVPKGARVIALDEHGKDMTTLQFSKLLLQETAFVLGGADGLDAAFKNDADLQLRLSAMTLPHALAQVVLLEQIYRAATLLTGHPYHRS